MALSLGFLLNADSDDAQAAVAELDEKFKELAKTTIENKAAHKEVSDILNKIAKNDLPLTSETMEKLAEAEKRAATASKELAEAQSKLKTETKEAAAAQESLRERVSLTSEGIKSSLYSYGSLAGGLGALLGVGIIGEYVNKLKEGELAVEHLSATTAISVGDLTRMKDAMEENGIQAELLDQALPRLTSHIFQAASGEAEAARTFAIFGINTEEWKKKMPSAIDVLRQMNEYMEKYGKSNSTAAGLTELFGVRSQKTASILKDLVESLDNPAYDAHAKAVTENAEAANSLEAVEARLKMQFDTALLPSLRVVSDAITGLTIMWDKIAEETDKATDYVVGFATAGVNALSGLSKVASDILSGDFKAATAHYAQVRRDVDADLLETQNKILDDEKTFQDKLREAMKPPPPQPGLGEDPNLLAKKLAEEARLKEEQAEELAQEREQAKLDKERTKEIEKFYEWQTKSLEKQKEEIALRAKKAAEPLKPPEFKDQITQGEMYAQVMKSILNGTDQLSEAVKKNALFTREAAKEWQEYYKAMKDKTGVNAAVQMIEQIITVHKKGLPTIIAFNMALRDEGKAAEESAKEQIAANAQSLLSHIAGLKAMAIIKAIINTAQGIEDLVPPPKPWSAALHFMAAAEWAKAAGGAGGHHPAAGGGGGGQTGQAAQGEIPGRTGLPGVVGGGGGGSGTAHQSIVNIYGGQITDTHNLQNLTAALNSGGQSGTIKMNTGGSAYSIPSPAY